MPTSLPDCEFFATDLTYLNTTAPPAPSVTFHCMAVSTHPGDGSLCAIGVQLVEGDGSWTPAIYSRAQWEAGGWKAVEPPDHLALQGCEEQPSDGFHQVASAAPAALHWDRALGLAPMQDGRIGLWLATDRGHPCLLTLDVSLCEELTDELRSAGRVSAERS